MMWCSSSVRCCIEITMRSIIGNPIMKKAQIRITETIAILIIFFILVMFGIIFFSQIQRTTFDQRSIQAAGERAVSTSLNALFLPELACTKGDAVEIKDCIDIFKLEAAATAIQGNIDYYFDIFQYATIRVEELYPAQREWALYSKTRDGSVPDEFTPKATTPVPVSLYDPLSREQYFG